MSKSKYFKLQESDLQPLVEQGDWAALIRYWLVHDLHPRVLDEAIRVLERRASAPDWLHATQIAQHLAVRRTNPTGIHKPNQSLLDACNDEEKSTLILVDLISSTRLFKYVENFHVAVRREKLEISLTANQLALDLAQELGDFALQQQYHDNIAGTLWKMDRMKDAYDHMVIAVGLARGLYQQEPGYFGRILAEALENLGLLQNGLQSLQEASACYLEAATLWDILAEQTDHACLERAATALTALGNLQYRQEDFEGACQSFERALSAYRTLAKDDVTAWRSEITAALYNVATTEHRLKRFTAARSNLMDSIDILHLLEDGEPNSDSLQIEIAKNLNTLGIVQDDMGDLREAHKTLQKALSIRRRLADLDPDRHNADLTMTLKNLYRLEHKLASGKVSPEALLEATEIERRMRSVGFGEEENKNLSADQIPVSPWVEPTRRFFALNRWEDLDKAISLCEDQDVVALLRSCTPFICNIPHENFQAAVDKFRSQSQRAEFAMVACLGMIPELNRLRCQEMEAIAMVVGINSDKLLELALFCERIAFPECAATIFFELGKYHAKRQELLRSKMLLQRALNNFERIPASEGDSYEGTIASVLNSLGSTLGEGREFTEAEQLLVRAAKLRRKQGERVYLANVLFNLGNLYMATGRLPLAKAALEDSYENYNMQRNSPDWEDTAPLAAKCMMTLGQALNNTGDLEGAERLLCEAIAIFRETHSRQEFLFKALAPATADYKPDLFIAMVQRASVLHEQKRFAEAREAFEECHELHESMPESSRSSINLQYLSLLSEYAGFLGELGEPSFSLDTHRKAIREAEKPSELTNRYLYKGTVQSSYRALLAHHARQGESSQVFRCLAALRDESVSAFSEVSEEGPGAAGEALLEREKKLDRKIHVIAAETLSSNNLLLSVIRGGQTEASYFIVPFFAQVGIRLFNNIRACIFGEKNRPGSDGDLNAIAALGRLAWKVLPQPVRNALLPQDNTDVLISGDSYWAAFPWEALRVDQQGKEEWLGHLQTLARWSPITAKGLSRLAPQSFGNGSRVAAVICPWDALPESLLSSAQGEAAMVSATLRDHHYHLIGGDALVGSAATKPAILQAITLEPSIIHFVGHGKIQGTEEVLMVWGVPSASPFRSGKPNCSSTRKNRESPVGCFSIHRCSS